MNVTNILRKLKVNWFHQEHLPVTDSQTAGSGMNSQPVVSVITIFLNAEKFIQEAIDSVFGQTFDSWELLLVDDGSTDASTDIARLCAEQYPDKVRYLEHDGHQNRGMSASRNLGLRRARGKYIALLDSDDVWLPQKLGRQVELLESRPEAAMVYGSALWWYSWTGRPEDLQRDFCDSVDNYVSQPNGLIKPPRLLTAFLRDGNAVPCNMTVLVRREALEQVGGFEESFHDLYEDQAFYAKICLNAPVYVEGKCWGKYRRHQESCFQQANESGRESIARQAYLNWLEKYLAEKEVSDAEVLEALREALRPYREQENGHHTPADHVLQLASLLRVQPVSRCWGFDRGLPIDRFYIEDFLSRHAADVHGRVLEVGDDFYTRRFGADRVVVSDVLHIYEGNPVATIVADLSDADHIPSDLFDCIILTQTLHLIYDVRAAIKTLHRILKPGGVLLTTFPGITQIVVSKDRAEDWGGSWHWAFTYLSARRLFEEAFSATDVQVETHGNVLAASAFLYGFAVEDVRREDLEHHDPDYEVIIAVRAVKPEAGG